MTTATYLAHMSAWSLLGFVAGVVLTLRSHRGQTQNQEVPAVPDDPVTTTTIPRRHRIRRLLKSNVLIVVMIIASTVQGVAFYGRTSDIVECQRIYQTGFADALDARSKSAAAAQETLDELWTKVAALISGAPGAEPRRQFLAALDSYLQKRAEAKKQQQLNPYPPSPRDLCQ